MSNPTLSSDLQARARAMHEAGRSRLSIARELGVSYRMALRLIDPAAYEKMLQQDRGRVKRPHRQKTRRGVPREETGPRPISTAELERRRAQIPEDTRDLTGRLLGDPMPGRSALDRESV